MNIRTPFQPSKLRSVVQSCNSCTIYVSNWEPVNREYNRMHETAILIVSGLNFEFKFHLLIWAFDMFPELYSYTLICPWSDSRMSSNTGWNITETRTHVTWLNSGVAAPGEDCHRRPQTSQLLLCRDDSSGSCYSSSSVIRNESKPIEHWPSILRKKGKDRYWLANYNSTG